MQVTGAKINKNQTVLFVDDEEIVLDVGVKMLEKMGYTVFGARDGKEAIEIYKKNQGKVDIVILDFHMPQMDGERVYEELKRIDPDLKILISTGYINNKQAAELLKRGCDGIIQKPFKIEELSGKINKITHHH